MLFGVNDELDDPIEQVEDIFMGELIIDYIVVHAGDYDPDDPCKPFHFLPGVVLLDDGQHQIRIFGKRKHCFLNESIAISEPLVLKQHALIAHVLAHVAIQLDQVAIVIF